MNVMMLIDVAAIKIKKEFFKVSSLILNYIIIMEHYIMMIKMIKKIKKKLMILIGGQ